MPNKSNIHNFSLVKNSHLLKEDEPFTDRCLKDAIGKLDDLLLIGHNIEGDLYISSTFIDKRQILWTIEDFKKRLMNGDYDEFK